MGSLARIKGVGEQQVEVVDSQGQLGIGLGGWALKLTVLEASCGAPETGAEGKPRSSVAQRAEEAVDFVGAVTRSVDNAQGLGRLRAASLDTLQQRTLELAAILGAIVINTAVGAVERGAGLGEVGRSQRRARVAHRNAERPESGRIVARPQREIGEDDAVAAKPTGRTKLGDDCVVGFSRGHQSTEKVGPKAPKGNEGDFGGVYGFSPRCW
jgi:hypothetical protein